MKMSRTATFLAGLLSIVILIITRCEALASVPCSTVIEEVAPCTSFLQESTKKPSQACCSGVKKVSGEGVTKKDRADICQCLKEGLALVGNYDPNLIPQLPKACGLSVKLPPIDKKTDCSK
uniref:Non-specific lipid-transfer protein n=1 Tax=Cajanus cajan TaxID=3821 RepID=A0A151TY04_CAJCA|nr:putative non-specific lipid-transfer protein 1 [Cajanus cajan]